MNANQAQGGTRWVLVAGLCLLCGIVGATAALAITAVWLGRTLEQSVSQVDRPGAGEQREPAGDEWSKPPPGEKPEPALGGPAKPTATAYLRVAAREPVVVFDPGEDADPKEFEIYKATQEQLLRNPFVLNAAVRRPEVAKLRCVKQQEDPIEWLAGELQVTFPGDAEVMQVSLPTADPREAAALLNAVVDAYLKEVVDLERTWRAQRLSELDRLYTEKNESVRQKLTDLRNLAETLGTSDTKAMSLKQELAVQELAEYQQEFMSTQFERRRAHGRLKAQQALLEDVDSLQISEVDVDIFVQSDPESSQLMQQLFALKQKLADVQSGAAPPANAPSAAKLQANVKLTEDQLEARRVELRVRLGQRRSAEIKANIKQMEIEIAVLAEQEVALRQDVQRKREEAEQLGRSSIDLEMMRSEIEQLQEVLSTVGMERERLRVELRAVSRIRLIQRAEAPE